MNTPVLFLIFNRPKETQEIFSAIRSARPKKLYIVADGPRMDRTLDAALCSETRRIVDQIDWECDLHTLFRDQNLGCKNSVSDGISWFFNNEEEGIILEDDCLPDPTFFTFCQTMLHKYRNDNRIQHIGGANFQNHKKIGNGDYYFSKLVHVWGWASWRRAWKDYDAKMEKWPLFKEQDSLRHIFQNLKISNHLNFVFQEVFDGKIDTWDYQWFFSNLANNGLSVIPNVNLISNIGFSANATHTMVNHPFANLKRQSINSSRDPEIFIPSFEADLHTLSQEALGFKQLLKIRASRFLKSKLK